MHRIAKLFEHLRYHSMKLAAVVSAGLFAFVQFVANQPDLILGIVGFVPGDPVVRFIFAVACGLVVYFGVDVVRFWPQPKLSDKKETEQ